MNDTDFKQKVMYKLGNIERHLENLNGATDENKKLGEMTAKKVATHDVIFGKIGIVITTGIFLIVTGADFLIDWVKNKLF